jgi:hypothetical protein
MSFIVEIIRLQQGGLCYSINNLVGHYLFAKKHKLALSIADNAWLFKHTLGLKDYFDSIDTHTPEKVYQMPLFHICTGDERISINRFTVKEYKEAFSFVTRLNKYMEEKKQAVMKELGLIEGKYDAIMIRRGEKIYCESYYIDTKDFITKLAERKTNIIFVQTDDYNGYLEACEEAKKIDPNIRVVTTCPPTQHGIINFKLAREGLNNLFYNKINNFVTQETNKEYCQETINKIGKSIEEYTPEEVRVHAEESIIGLEICSLSRFLCMDLQSNVNRYLFLKHNNIENIIIVESKNPNTWPNVIPKLDTLIQYPIYDFHKFLSKDLQYLGPPEMFPLEYKQR